uniref:Uncharacterized protein n=1 Tax=Acrobeloides nanus TaxID=290746 RepID=A0A914DP52_9BILA
MTVMKDRTKYLALMGTI